MSGKKGQTAVEIAARHTQVVRLRLAGRTWAEIAEEVGLTDRACRAAWYAFRDSEKTLMVEEDPLDVVFEHIAGFKELRRLSAEVFAESAAVPAKDKDGNFVKLKGGGYLMAGANSSVRVAALKLVAEMRVREIDLRQQTGLLPRNLGKLQVELDVRWILDQVFLLLQKHDVPDEALAEFETILARQAGERAGEQAGELVAETG